MKQMFTIFCREKICDRTQRYDLNAACRRATNQNLMGFCGKRDVEFSDDTVEKNIGLCLDERRILYCIYIHKDYFELLHYYDRPSGLGYCK